MSVLQINLVGGRFSSGSWSAQFEINEESMQTEDLHRAIQRLLSFDDDHMYKYCIGRTRRSWKEVFSDDNEEDVTLAKIFPLPKNFKLFYLFDFGDSWLFDITRRSTKGGVDFSHNQFVISNEIGVRPRQYGNYDNEI